MSSTSSNRARRRISRSVSIMHGSITPFEPPRKRQGVANSPIERAQRTDVIPTRYRRVTDAGIHAVFRSNDRPDKLLRTPTNGAQTMTIHIGAKPGEIAETVLLPGDPYRAKWAAETFLDDAKCINEVRGMLGFTGTWKGNRVTIHGSGMGMPSLSIYAQELICDYDAKTLIRIGSCGGMQDKVKVRDVILAMTASSLSTPSSGIFKELNFAPSADWSLLSAAAKASENKGVSTHVGGVYSTDVFYDERPDLNEQMVRHGILGVEMEAAELYNLAARHNRRALAVLTVSDHLITGDSLPADQRETSFGDMVEIALEAAFT